MNRQANGDRTIPVTEIVGVHIAERITTEKVAEQQQQRSQQRNQINSFMRNHFLALFRSFSNDANGIANL